MCTQKIAIRICAVIFVLLSITTDKHYSAAGFESYLGQSNGATIYWGAYVDDVPHDLSKLDAFEANTKKKVSIVHWGQPWMMGDKYQKFQTQLASAVRWRGAIPMINWGSWHLGGGVIQADFQLREIYEGRHDTYITEWANDAKSYGYPIFLRFNHEMNGWWFPWSEQVNGNKPGDFVKAWRHVHDIFAKAGARNVTWVWCINRVDSPLSTPVETLYPGDKYVDWVAMDGYNGGPDGDKTWKSFLELFRKSYDKLVALSPDKPIMVAEFASTEYIDSSTNSKAAWIRDALGDQLEANFPQIKALVWFNWNSGDPDRDWPIESSSSSINAFAESIASPKYSSNEFHCITASPIRPLSGTSASSICCISERSCKVVYLPLIQ